MEGDGEERRRIVNKWLSDDRYDDRKRVRIAFEGACVKIKDAHVFFHRSIDGSSIPILAVP